MAATQASYPSDKLESELQAHRGDILRYIRRSIPAHLQRVFEAEDLLQDIYLEAAVSLHTFSAEQESSLRRWIFTIARNRILRLIRDQSAIKRVGLHTAKSELRFGHMIMLLEELAVYARTPSQSAMGREAAIMVDRAVSELPHDYRSAIRVRYIEGKSVGEAARVLERSERAVHMLCYRAMQELRSTLQGVML